MNSIKNLLTQIILINMNLVILETGDEDIYDVWFSEGIPDGCDDETYAEIAENEEEFNRIRKVFNNLMGKGEE